MQITKNTAAVLSVLLLAGSLSACGSRPGSEESSQPPMENNPVTVETTVTPDTAPEIIEIDTPLQGNHTLTDETAITLGDTVTVTGNGATAEGSTVTVTAAGTYLISGTCSDGRILVDTTDNADVTLLLNGVSLSCGDGPALLITSAPKKVVLSTVAGSVNILSDGTDYVIPDEAQVEGTVYPNACIYACDDLTLAGEGSLSIKGNADKGINTKDDLKIKSGTITVTSVGVGIRGNDSVEISGGTVTVLSGGDGIKSGNTETAGKGYVTFSGGDVYITATGDGISAATDLTVTGGTAVITTKDADAATDSASTASYSTVYDNSGNARRPGMPPGGGGMPPGGGGMGGGMSGGMGGGMPGEGNNEKSSISAKGLKAAGTLTVQGGKLTVDAADDGIHSNDTVVIANGTLHITSADDGIHADNILTVSGGVTEIAQSYEGLEAHQITIAGGTNRIYARDDGTNANGGSSMGPGGWGGAWGGVSEDTDTSDQSSPLLTVSGGYTVLYADGDGLDSNGNIVMTGGILLVYGPTNNGNGPIDYGDGSYKMTVSGGTLLAIGSSGMADTAQNNGQAVFAARMNSLSAGTLIGIKDGNGRLVAAFRIPKAIASIVYSSPALTAGETYTFVYGGTAGEDTDGVINDLTTYTGYTAMGSLEAY